MYRDTNSNNIAHLEDSTLLFNTLGIYNVLVFNI